MREYLAKFIYLRDFLMGKRSVSQKDIKILITKSGGRCSFNKGGSFCNKLLVTGKVCLGEVAHIVGLNGPRSEEPIDCDKNDYENLIWLCRDCHKIIDDNGNLKTYTVDVLKDMKARHESRVEMSDIENSWINFQAHDYSVLSCIFEYVDISTVYDCAATFPLVNDEFFYVGEMLSTFQRSNQDALPLKDPVLNKSFEEFIRSQLVLEAFLNRCSISSECYEEIIVSKHNYDDKAFNEPLMKIWKDEGCKFVLDYLESVESLLALIKNRFSQIFNQNIFDSWFAAGLDEQKCRVEQLNEYTAQIEVYELSEEDRLKMLSEEIEALRA